MGYLLQYRLMVSLRLKLGLGERVYSKLQGQLVLGLRSRI